MYYSELYIYAITIVIFHHLRKGFNSKMSTPARKSGRQAKPTEKFKEYLYEREVPAKIEHKSSVTGHFQSSKEQPSADATVHTTLKKRGRPRKSNLEVDPLKIIENNPESDDEDKYNDAKFSKNKKGPRKEANFKPQPECNSSTMTDTDSEGEFQGRKSEEFGPRRSGRPPKLNKRLLNYLHSDEGTFGESGHLSKKRKENSEIMAKRVKKHYYIEELENTRDDNEVKNIQHMTVIHEPGYYQIGPAVKCVRNTSISNKKTLERLKSSSPDKTVVRECKEEITDIKRTMICKLEELSRKMLEDDTNHFLKLASEDLKDIDDPFVAFQLENNKDLDDETSEKVLKWLVEEEIERQRYRKKLFESLKKSHEKSMNMFNQMLKALENV